MSIQSSIGSPNLWFVCTNAWWFVLASTTSEAGCERLLPDVLQLSVPCQDAGVPLGWWWAGSPAKDRRRQDFHRLPMTSHDFPLKQQAPKNHQVQIWIQIIVGIASIRVDPGSWMLVRENLSGWCWSRYHYWLTLSQVNSAWSGAPPFCVPIARNLCFQAFQCLFFRDDMMGFRVRWDSISRLKYAPKFWPSGPWSWQGFP